MLDIVHGVAAVEALTLGVKLGLSIKALTSMISNAAGASRSFEVVAMTMMGGQRTSIRTLAQSRDILVRLFLIESLWSILIRNIAASHDPCSSL